MPRHRYTTANYTYASASLDFTRAPQLYMTSYFLPSVVMVVISSLGFYMDPIATPARVALGMLSLLVVLTNYIALTNALPPTSGARRRER